MTYLPKLKEYIDAESAKDANPKKKKAALFRWLSEASKVGRANLYRIYNGATTTVPTARKIQAALGGAPLTAEHEKPVRVAASTSAERGRSVLYPPDVTEDEALRRFRSSDNTMQTPAECEGCWRTLVKMKEEGRLPAELALPHGRAVCKINHGFVLIGGRFTTRDAIADEERMREQALAAPATAEAPAVVAEEKTRPTRKRGPTSDDAAKTSAAKTTKKTTKRATKAATRTTPKRSASKTSKSNASTKTRTTAAKKTAKTKTKSSKSSKRTKR